MNDGRGRHVDVGDTVQIWPGRIGTIVCSFEDQGFSEDFSRADWGHLTQGALIRMPDGSLFHYKQADEDFVILKKCDV